MGRRVPARASAIARLSGKAWIGQQPCGGKAGTCKRKYYALTWIKMLVTAGSKMKNDVIDVMIARQANVQRTSTSAIPKGKYEIIIMTTFF